MEFKFDNELDSGTTQNVDLRKTGVYDVELQRVEVVKNKSGSIGMNITVDGGGKYPQTYWMQGAIIFSSDGKPGWAANKILKPIRFFAGQDITTVPTEKETLEFNGKEITVISGVKGTKLKIAVQSKWNDYKGSYEPSIEAVFDPAGYSAKERQQGATEAKQIQYFLSDKFKDVDPKGGNKTKPKDTASDVLEEDVDSVF